MKKILFSLIIGLTCFQGVAVVLKVPNLHKKGYKELKAYSKELKYVKELKNQYKKKNKILDDLRKYSTALIKEQKKFIIKKDLYTKKMKQFQIKKNFETKRKRPTKRIDDLKMVIYVAKIRRILKQQSFLKNCYQRELRENQSFIEGLTSGIFKISKQGHILDFKFISPYQRGLHSKNIMNCLSFHITRMIFPHPPHKKQIRILQTFEFKISG